MRDGFESYRAELEGVRLTEESKRSLKERLQNHSRETGHRPRRLPAGARLAAVAAVICLLTGAGVAVAAASPTLQGMFGGGAGYGQSSGLIGRSVERGGWTVTITDCVGDDLNLYVGLELTAPEGTVLDADDYFFGEDGWGGTIEFTSPAARGMGMTWTQARQLPDDNPADNRLTFVSSVRGFSDKTGDGRSYNGQQIRMVLPGLYHSTGWDQENRKPILVQDCGTTWDFGRMTVSYPDSTIRLEPNVTVTTLDVEAVVTSIEISPLCVQVHIAGDELKGHHDWVPKNAPDGFYGCMEYQEITLYDKDGGAYSLTCENCDLSGSGCSGGTDTSEDGFVHLRRAYGRSGNEQLVDVENLSAISVCGVLIPIE